MRRNPVLAIALIFALVVAGVLPARSLAQTPAPDLAIARFELQLRTLYLPISLQGAGARSFVRQPANFSAVGPAAQVPTGTLVPYQIAIQNLGNAPSAATSVAFFVDAFLGRLDVPALAPGESAALRYLWSATPAGLRTAQTLLARVDDDALIAESDEANNEATAPLPVVGPPPLTVTQQTAVDPAFVLAQTQGDAAYQDVTALANTSGYTGPLVNTYETHYSNGLLSWIGERKDPARPDDLGILVMHLRLGDRQISYLIERLAADGDFRMFDRTGGIRYVDGVLSTFTSSGTLVAAGLNNCSEPWFWICVGVFGTTVVACILGVLASETGIGVAAAVAACGGAVASGYECIQRLTDNNPEIYIRNAGDAGTCSGCDGDSKVVYAKILVEATGTDDRGPVDFPGGSSQTICLNQARTVSFTGVDCGGNSVTASRTFGPREVSRTDCKTVISPPECAQCQALGETAQCVKKQPCETPTPRPLRVRSGDGWRLIVPTPAGTPEACAPAAATVP